MPGSAGTLRMTVEVSTAMTPTGVPPSRARPVITVRAQPACQPGQHTCLITGSCQTQVSAWVSPSLTIQCNNEKFNPIRTRIGLRIASLILHCASHRPVQRFRHGPVMPELTFSAVTLQGQTCSAAQLLCRHEHSNPPAPRSSCHGRIGRTPSWRRRPSWRRCCRLAPPRGRRWRTAGPSCRLHAFVANHAETRRVAVPSLGQPAGTAHMPSVIASQSSIDAYASACRISLTKFWQ